MKKIAEFLLKRSLQTFLIIFWYIYQILKKIFYKQKKLSYMVELTYNFCHVVLAHGLKLFIFKRTKHSILSSEISV